MRFSSPVAHRLVVAYLREARSYIRTASSLAKMALQVGTPTGTRPLVQRAHDQLESAQRLLAESLARMGAADPEESTHEQVRHD